MWRTVEVEKRNIIEIECIYATLIILMVNIYKGQREPVDERGKRIELQESLKVDQR